MKLDTLLKNRADLLGQMRNFIDTHEDSQGKLSADDAATYGKMEADFDSLTNSIEREKKNAQREEMLEQPTSRPLTSKPHTEIDDTKKTGRASDEYRQAMISAMRTGFRHVSNVMQEGVDGDGGYLVPVEMDSRIIAKLNEENIMRGLATVITTAGEHKINIAATNPAAAWMDEGAALSFGDSTFDQKILDAYKLAVAVKATEELLYDSAFNVESYISDKIGDALANAEEDAFLNGNGTGKPTGIFDATNGGTIAATLTAAIKSDDVFDLVYALKRPYRKNASFIMNDLTLASLRKLKDNNGAYIWQPSYQAGEPDTLMGYKVNTSAYAPTTAISFGDYSFYNIGDRGTRSLRRLDELFAGNGMIGFVGKERVDGKLILKEAVQILKLNS